VIGRDGPQQLGKFLDGRGSRAQTMLINEHRLSPIEPDAREFIEKEGIPGGGGLPYLRASLR
jgi:hypothetical protein